MTAASTQFAHTPRARAVANVLAFQAAWFGCVTAAAHNMPGWGIAAVAAAIMLHGALSSNVSRDLLLALIAVAVGVVWETVALHAGWIAYASPGPIAGFAPAWILALWALLATTLREPLRWMHGRPWFAATAGAIGGPLSYAAAQRVGACSFTHSLESLIALGAGWALISPLLLEAARRLDIAAAEQPA